MIDHVALLVQNIEAVREFFIKYFGAGCGDMYHNPRTGLSSYFLSFGDGCRLELINIPGKERCADRNRFYGYAHMALKLGSREAVDALAARMASDGFEVLSGPRVTGDGYYEACICGPEDNLIEIMA